MKSEDSQLYKKEQEKYIMEQLDGCQYQGLYMNNHNNTSVVLKNLWLVHNLHDVEVKQF